MCTCPYHHRAFPLATHSHAGPTSQNTQSRTRPLASHSHPSLFSLGFPLSLPIPAISRRFFTSPGAAADPLLPTATVRGNESRERARR
jgi:hypothetical protein